VEQYKIRVENINSYQPSKFQSATKSSVLDKLSKNGISILDIIH